MKDTRPQLLQTLFTIGNACISIETDAFSTLIDAFSTFNSFSALSFCK